MAISEWSSVEFEKTGRLRSLRPKVVGGSDLENVYHTSNLVFDSSVASANVASLVGGLSTLCEDGAEQYMVKVILSEDFAGIEE